MHLGIIMDGNRRWAKQKGFPKIMGHKKGADNLETIIDICLQKKVNILTVYALSTENLKREPEELKNLFNLIEKYVKNTQKFIKQDIQVQIIGDTSSFPKSTKAALEKVKAETQNCETLIFNIALGYGGRNEIIRTVNTMLKNKTEITIENLNQNLDTKGLADPDLIIRTGGDHRLSNFLLWQSSYSTLYFTPIFWPDFNEKELVKALAFFSEQKQNYGK